METYRVITVSEDAKRAWKLLKLPVLMPYSEKNWGEKKEPEVRDFKKSAADLAAGTMHLCDVLIERGVITLAWPFNEKLTVLEHQKGSLLVAMPFDEVEKLLREDS